MSSHQPLPETAGPPVCPRHPDRISYVRCQRCGRPVCPECQRQAPVGVQCVDCVAEAARGARPTQTVLGGRVHDGRPVVTITIIALCVVSYVLQLAVPGWTSRWAFLPAAGQVEPYRFLTTAFLHSPSSIFHILFNMYALWIVGPFLENALGRARYIALYLISAVAGSVGVLLFASPVTDAWYVAAVGASGAVFGLFGAVLVVLRRLGRNAQSFLVIIGLNLVIGFVIPQIAWQAHVGGLVVGAGLGAAYAYSPTPRRREAGIVATVVAAVLVVGLAMVKYAGV
ncbi:MAG: rhomboid family intramembrane serine protease [Cellulomonas sp.]|uniref:rhomboid family intramembrane serine protease n=1 Tax=Cellulomonas sp. TaxID=40001 RepID=UPI0018178FCF|nr:rhomboid family intramembrane serine protease [Cellulomonas sp.]NMM15901.1 rhomboid family intramembrane serine protease [Cellulomonas sp.]NMM29935.1 rhomboid family intramembrane serine protease [Cellulomonas sp.]